MKNGSMSFLLFGSHCKSLVDVSWFCKSFQTNGITETVYLEHEGNYATDDICVQEGMLCEGDRTLLRSFVNER
jgi:hypothetical protein